ncbi:MAG: hypothetical protein JO093_13995 [Acidobacteria bacterium]|nr:hypothetical protein [Acidobacteriota bacterium]MBV9068579.1 hypothetical protein [Acidobacteriota bacterium]MBV9186727.1 hypothetical protein [Acidobacteriota bacterium]
MTAQVAHVQLVHEQGKAGDKLRLRTWIEVQLIGEDDKPIPYQKYTIALPGGAIRSGTLDENGSARIEGIPAGTCKVSFPDLDQDAWTAVETKT